MPWAAGGSTDQITRVTAAELEKVLGQKIIVVNQPGASGSIGSKNAWEAPKDGYTWTAGAAQDLGTYQALGMLDVPAKDWHLFLSVANIAVVGVGAQTPYQNMQQLLDAMKAKPGEIKVATAGVTSGGHNAMEAISRATGVKYRHVTYDGGNPAVVATVSGETDVTTQLAVEQAEMIRGKRIRPLATVSDRAAGDRGLRHHRADQQGHPRLQGAGQLLRHLHPQGRAAGGGGDDAEDLDREHRQQRRDQGLRREQGRAVRAGRGRCRAGRGDAGDPGQRLAAALHRQDQGGAGHGGHRQALTEP